MGGGRAMSTVYAPSTPSSWTPVPMLTPSGHTTSGYSTPSRRHSPHSVQELLSYGSSPISANFPGHVPGHSSPSIFLQQRSSPYKPVRHVNTLLYPPPSRSMQIKCTISLWERETTIDQALSLTTLTLRINGRPFVNQTSTLDRLATNFLMSLEHWHHFPASKLKA